MKSKLWVRVQFFVALALAACVTAATLDLGGHEESAEVVPLDLGGNISTARVETPPETVELSGELIQPWAWRNVKEAIDGIADVEALTVNYSGLNEIQMAMLKERNVVLESEKPLHWTVLLNEVLRGLKFGFIQNDAGVVEVLPFDAYHAYKTGEAQRVLSDNHETVEVTLIRMPLLQAVQEVAEQAGVSLNTGYLPLEVRDPESAQQALIDAVDSGEGSAPPVPVMTSSFKTVIPMEWRNVLKNILDPYGYAFVEIDGAVCPMKKERAQSMRAGMLAERPMVRQVVPLFYADPSDMMARILELDLLSSRGKISLTQSAGQNTINDGSAGLRPRVREDLIVCDVEENVLLATEWIRKLDVSDGQVVIEARILSITENDEKNMGVKWSGYENFFNATFSGTSSKWQLGTWRTGLTSLPNELPLEPGSALLATLTSSQLQASLHMLHEFGNTEFLSHPLVVLGNRTEGTIDIVETRPVVVTEVNVSDNGSTTTTYNFEDQEVGLTLWLSPEISPDGEHVRLSVHQKLDNFREEPVVDPNGSEKFPVLTRELDTRALVRNGDTLVVGGLVETRHTVTDEKVPFIGDIPYLGRLFSYKGREMEKRNLVIMLTPTILDKDTPATGYEQKSETMSEELSAQGTDYFHIDGEESEATVEDGFQGLEKGASKDASLEKGFQGLEEKVSDEENGARKLKPIFG